MVDGPASKTAPTPPEPGVPAPPEPGAPSPAGPRPSSWSTPDWLAYRAATVGSRAALVGCGVQWSFAELHARACRTARRLAALGVRPGDRVGLLLPNGPAFVELVHAVGYAGAVAVPVNTRLAPAEVAWQLGHAGVRLVLCGPDTLPTAEAAVAGTGAACVLAEALERMPESPIPLRERVEFGAVHSIVYTSGTTGRPKAAMLTYGNHWWSAVGSALNLGIRPDDRWLACMPLFHVGGLAILMRSAIYGMTVVVQPRFDPQAVNEAIDRQGVTLLSVVATMLARVLDAREGRPYPPTLRAVLVGGGPTPLPLLERAAALGMPVVPTYGLTEAASQVAALPPEQARARLASAGRPLLPTEVRIEQDGRPAAPGEPGEILVRGPTLSPGYYADPAATARAFRGGWFHTGDVGYLDAEGLLYVLDRRDDLIISGGENVYPAEVEAVLTQHPAVAEAAVAGAPDAEWGQVPVAAVRLRPGFHASEAELLDFCRARLARYKVPRRVQFVDALPRNAAGKVVRRALTRAADPATPGGLSPR